ncbi:biotin transporter BioY [Clostridium sp. SHJSY1]|uniref:biotin transporter BioY n=1 Tax=Clostridium sp. SHJSY1 TaxID=2942483 RepID=UPI002876A77D|nr:biotin transporter BioY [Clostridium sp. SHJSY1]MDS0527236.1 biotin transporter BioY [Clostridium sp. SHJSY1]
MKKRIDLRKQIICAIFAGVMAILAQIAVPLPFTTVPITMVTFAVTLVAVVLGGRLGAISVLVYILLGAIGIPVFAGFKGGFQTLIGATGGYLISFPIVAAIIGYFSYRYKKNYLIISLASIFAFTVCYFIGTVQLMFVANLGIKAALMAGVIPFVIFDIIKVILAVFIGVRLQSSIMQTNLLKA